MGRLSIVGLSGGRLARSRLISESSSGTRLVLESLMGLGLWGAACPDVLKDPGTRVSLPVARYFDSSPRSW